MIDNPTIAARSIPKDGIGRLDEPRRESAHRGDRRAFWRDVLATDFVNPPRRERTWHRQRTLTVVLAIALAAAWQAIGG